MLRTGFSSLGNFSTNLLKISIPLFCAKGILLNTMLYANSFKMFLSFPMIFSKSLTLSSTFVSDKVLHVVLIFDSFDSFSVKRISLVLSRVVKMSKSLFYVFFVMSKVEFVCRDSYSRDGIITWGSGGGLFFNLIASLSFFSLSTLKLIGGSTDLISDSTISGSF